jgi:hypothetical protein
LGGRSDLGIHHASTQGTETTTAFCGTPWLFSVPSVLPW